MKSIIYVGMDVNKASFTLSCFSVTTQETFATVKISPDAKAIKKYLDGVSLSRSEECEFVCGFEAGCLGYTLYHQLTAMNIIRDYLRMRDDHKLMLKKIKQQINAFCLKHNKIYPGNKSWYVISPKVSCKRFGL